MVWFISFQLASSVGPDMMQFSRVDLVNFPLVVDSGERLRLANLIGGTWYIVLAPEPEITIL